MFEYIEAETDENIELGLYQSMIGVTWVDETPENLQDSLLEMGYSYIKVVGLSDRKFILRNEESPEWKDFAFKNLSHLFSVIRKFKEEDMIVPRTVWIECSGLPMLAWLEENLKAFSARLGEWVTWSYQKDDINAFFNPLICLQSCEMSQIEDEMTVLVKGKKYKIKFKEIQNRERMKDKMDHMQEKEVANSWSKESNERIDDNSNDPVIVRAKGTGKISKKGAEKKNVVESHDSMLSAFPETVIQQGQLERNEYKNVDKGCCAVELKELGKFDDIERFKQNLKSQESSETNDTN
ncbi:hypothetical protein POM88_044828 [Heracleum sosnowskyi]|uniref:DUF4283 domain-containing protein n=1 Tax=Heracleum sosnowskyi TaxID=360622 RepID=A0AAD8H4N3_9APIA|nr:hypothetical protein POM88_044828 [Heracleum sosnowskyi]